MFFELYAKVASHSLTALKMCSKCSFIPYKLRFFAHFRLVMKRDPTFAYASFDRNHLRHLFSFARRQAHSELCNCHCNTEAGRESVTNRASKVGKLFPVGCLTRTCPNNAILAAKAENMRYGAVPFPMKTCYIVHIASPIPNYFAAKRLRLSTSSLRYPLIGRALSVGIRRAVCKSHLCPP
uniref:Uncharacterized protein n=2 Tax=Candidatus Kentrum sp. FM TaxID=2126340 RepID=A0A450SZA5_9GAMM|nr:MAG: hypothetical protein BECKFM1743A_GA0114220_101804 [Candidatus Kentron sp. FM]VFJ59490.1 MAG: hypothetical protein BECKFM1743C_GA0114222_102473 [Candidatus Kentron sp. FM]